MTLSHLSYHSYPHQHRTNGARLLQRRHYENILRDKISMSMHCTFRTAAFQHKQSFIFHSVCIKSSTAGIYGVQIPSSAANNAMTTVPQYFC